jgi:tetratricopeptide (TPR) repeat protein
MFEAEPDFMTLLGAANSHAEQAENTPLSLRASDGRGSLRDELLDQAESYLDRAEAYDDKTAVGREVRAYITFVRGDYLLAARLYEEARSREGCSDEMRSDLVLNQARSLIKAERFPEVIALFEQDGQLLISQNETQGAVLRARALLAVGDHKAARELAREIESSDDKGANHIFAAGEIFEKVGDRASAEAAYSKALASNPLGNYFLARLKVRGGQLDRGIEMLGRALSDARLDTLQLLRNDRELWASHISEERLSDLMNASGKAATPGR